MIDSDNSSAKKWTWNIPSLLQQAPVKHGLLSAGMLLAALIAGNVLNVQAERVAQRWTQGLKYADASSFTPNSASSTDNDKPSSTTNDKANLNLYLNSFKNSTPAERDRIQVQLAQIERRARAYARISIFFYTRLFAAIALASATGIVTAVSLFYISKVGWDKANNYVINIFVISSSITIFVGAFPIIFQQENNVTNNARLYMSYLDLENQILTALATQKNDQGQLIDLRTIMVSTDQKMAELNVESIGFDPDAIPRSADIFQQLESGQ
ncbi:MULTISPECIES: hypothetical protein [unclassified Leptolyngbya]|uniref:hypothetical protein n=1 Tax=unclassified Leptolyngbya TaxID=2650499 RepID=UPI0016879BB4|nr:MULTISPECIES: hypothetical protein [unclassified Leptolyngbya]MBD1911358.1 hypothetical protein [Leptolyngbya sp. FACHB-8]MBD2156624.1 hypothetical protein [Leptolyngbya sp. FACHB-16]